MSDQLTANQLEVIQRLISEPLRLAVRAEMQAGQERLIAAVSKVADQLESHVSDTLRRDRVRDGRIAALETRAAGFERFRGKVLVVYGALTLVLSLAWTVLRDWVANLGHRR